MTVVSGKGDFLILIVEGITNQPWFGAVILGNASS